MREKVGLDKSVPIVVMEWPLLWFFWEGRWDKIFPEETYGKVILDVHIYDFKGTVEEEERSWDWTQWPLLKHIASQAPTMLGEYTLSLSQDIPTEKLQPWAQYVQDRVHANGAIGSAHWLWNDKARKFWSMRSMSTSETEGGIDWSQVFSSGDPSLY